ncbi:MAG: hypothetical protein JXR88_12580 [Clostridia bacterium]|nr:hypothetical protein [Clostridia bacterium]
MIKGGFFESKLSDGVYDREYSSKDYADRWKKFLSNGIAVDGGGLITTKNEVSIIEDTMTTKVSIGSGYINGYDYNIISDEIVTHEAADPTNPRIDRVVVELNLDEATRAFVVKAIKGVPAVAPVAPDLIRTDSIWQLSLAQVLVPENVVVLNTGSVTDERSDDLLCGVSNVKLGITPPSGDVDVEMLKTEVQNQLTIERLSKDANDIFTEIQYKRLDGSLFKRSILSGGISPQYTSRTVNYYAQDGITIIKSLSFNLIYTGDDLTSEVIQ